MIRFRTTGMGPRKWRNQMISVERSEVAWQSIAAAVSDPVATILADQLAELRGLLLEAFPQATSFVRPGFDEPWR